MKKNKSKKKKHNKELLLVGMWGDLRNFIVDSIYYNRKSKTIREELEDVLGEMDLIYNTYYKNFDNLVKKGLIE